MESPLAPVASEQHMPECKLCGRRRPAGRLLLFAREDGQLREHRSEYACRPCQRLLFKGAIKGHLFRHTGLLWWLPQYARQLSN